MEIQQAEAMMHSLMRFHGVNGYKFQWMRTRKRFRMAGYCDWNKKVISIQPRFVICNQPVIVKQTMIHEIAHALQPKQGHNKIWKAQARKIGHSGSRTYGKEVRKRRSKKVSY